MKIQEIQFPLNIGTADELRIHIGQESENDSTINVHYVLLDTNQTTDVIEGRQLPYKSIYSDKIVVTGNDYAAYKIDNNYINQLVVNLLGVTPLTIE